MKLIIFIICSVFFISCENQEINTLELTSENKENAISNNERNLIRTFDDDYSLWMAEDNLEIYEDLSEKLGFFSSFEELREAQYRSKGIITDLTSLQSIVPNAGPVVDHSNNAEFAVLLTYLNPYICCAISGISKPVNCA